MIIRGADHTHRLQNGSQFIPVKLFDFISVLVSP